MSVSTNIFGHWRFADLPSVALATVTEPKAYDYLTTFAAAESAALSLLLGALSEDGQEVASTFGSGLGGRMQVEGEYGGIEATRMGAEWSVAYPIRSYADRAMYTGAYLDEATLADLNAHAVNAALKDVETSIVAAFTALLNKTNATFNDNPWPGRRTGSLTIRRLANADSSDGSVYYNGAEIALASRNHYVTSGSGTLATTAFENAYDTLQEVGNGADVVHVVSEATGKLTAALTGFAAPPNPLINVPNATTAVVRGGTAIGRLDATHGNGEVQVWPHFPDGYLFSYDRSKPRPLRRRLHPLQKYRGFQLVADETTGGERPGRPLLNKFWRNVYGFGVRNRLNGVATQITASGTYTSPTL